MWIQQCILNVYLTCIITIANCLLSDEIIELHGPCYAKYETSTYTDKFELNNMDNCVIEEADDVLSDIQKEWFFGLSQSSYTKLAIRKEFRAMEKADREKFVSALVGMKNRFVDGVSELDVFINMHAKTAVPAGNRGGPSTIPWHREYYIRMENAMRRYDTEITLPFWDPFFDVYLPKATDSINWSPSFLGECSGPITGTFEQFTVNDECKSKTDYDYIFRDCGSSDIAQKINGSIGPLNAYEYHSFAQFKTYAEFGSELCVLRNHDYLHNWLGGVGGVLASTTATCAASDPMAVLIHSLVDLLWENSRIFHQIADLQTDYPNKTVGGEAVQYCHLIDSPRFPFEDSVNGDGLSFGYTTNSYVYETLPHFCAAEDGCGTDSLWCDTANSRCVSKIQKGGYCESLPDIACMEGSCKQQYCQD